MGINSMVRKWAEEFLDDSFSGWDFMLSLPRAWVQSLVWELGSFKLHGATKKRKNNPVLY